jgi:hypothetical protein
MKSLPHLRTKLAAISSDEAPRKVHCDFGLSCVTTPPAKKTQRTCRHLLSPSISTSLRPFVICFLAVWRPSGSQIPRTREMSRNSHHPAMMDPPWARPFPIRNQSPDLIKRKSTKAYTISVPTPGSRCGSVAGSRPPNSQTTTQVCETRAISSRDR